MESDFSNATSGGLLGRQGVLFREPINWWGAWSKVRQEDSLAWSAGALLHAALEADIFDAIHPRQVAARRSEGGTALIVSSIERAKRGSRSEPRVQIVVAGPGFGC